MTRVLDLLIVAYISFFIVIWYLNLTVRMRNQSKELPIYIETGDDIKLASKDT